MVAAPLRRLLIAMLGLAALAGLGACERAAPAPTAPPEPAGPKVVLYSSVDGDVLRPLVERFERQSGIKVLVVGDTEATKAVGLVQRLVAEQERPRADVWWNSEAVGSVRLARGGVLEPYVPQGVSEEEGWTVRLRGLRQRWQAVALRPRVLMVNTRFVSAGDYPASLRDLASPRFKDRVGMAKAIAGTTLGHLAAIYALDGPEATRAWLIALRDNGLRSYDGNGAVARAVGSGELRVGIVDLDDVLSGQREGWPVEVAPIAAPSATEGGLLAGGTLFTPGTVGLVAGAPHPAEARRLIDFIVSAEVETALAQGPQRCTPVRRALSPLGPQPPPADPRLVDWDRVEGSAAAALALWTEVMGN